MKTVHHTATLFYYDGPQVFEARDVIGGHYIGVMVESAAGEDRYVIAGVEPERLREFRVGMLDLRTLLTERLAEEWFLGSMPNGLTEPMALEPRLDSLAESGFLPEPGFVLHEQQTGEFALKEARERNNLVLEVVTDPPEAAEEHRIRVATLIGLLGHVQTMVKHAYGAALRELKPESRKVIDRTDACLLDVVIPAATGSFRVVLEAAKTPDMLGQNELARALHRVDTLFESAGNPERTLATVKAHRGHLAGAFLRLLRFLVQHKTGLRYSWAEPSFSRQETRAVTEAEAGPLVEVLSGVSNLGGESVTLIGEFQKMNLGTGSWGLLTDEGLVSGRVREGGPSLDGLKARGRYRFSCVEEIEEVEGTGREQRTLYLIEHQPA